MKLQIIVILLATVGIVTGIAQLGDGQIFITVTSEGKAKVSQSIFPETFVSIIDVQVISENISNLLAIDEENILLGTTQNNELLKIATLGASAVDLKYNADILSYESGIFKLKYNSDLESRVNLPPLSKLVSLNTIPIEITDEEYVLPPGDISMSFSIRPVTSKEFFIPVENTEYKIEAITAAKIEQFSANSDEIQFIIKDKAIVLTIIPTKIMSNPNDALLNGEKVDFSQFHKNSTHSWIRIDPHEKGLVKILDTTERTEEGGGCLIATATYGSEMAPQVQFLREIRDNQLMNTDSGVSFMAGFNSFYYSFSPYVADMERENPMFKELVKIGITPLLSTLSVMEYAETEHEILGLGIRVILMNIGMYFVLPFVICYASMSIIRTRGMKKSNWEVISNCNYKSVMKIGLFGLVALFVLSVSIPSAFAQSTESEEQNPIQVILDISYENIQESFVDAEINPEDYPAVFIAAQEEYEEAMAALEAGDLETAEESALLAMALFEDSAEEIAEILEVQQATIQPLGLSTAASNVFNVQERITDTDDETDELRELVKLNNFDDVDFSEYDESVNLAKTLLADGFVPDAQAQLELANSIKDNLYDEISTIAGEQAAEEIKETLGEQENLGLTNKAINDLEDILEDLTTETEDGETSVDDTIEDSGEESSGNSENAPGQNQEGGPGNSENAPGQNQEGGPGNSENAPGQNQEESEFDLPPGFGAAGDNPSENAFANGQGVGLGKLPPGLAKKMFEAGGIDDEIGDGVDLPPGFGSAGDNPSENNNGQGLGVGGIPPGQLKKFDDIYSVYSPDDYFDDATEDLVEDSFEEKFDKMNKNSKAKEKKDKKEKDTKDKAAKGNTGGGNPNCDNEGIYGLDALSDTGNTGVDYTVSGLTAVGSNCKDSTSNIKITIDGPNSPPAKHNNENQPFTFQPDEVGTWIIEVRATGQFASKSITVTTVGNAPDANAENDQTVTEGDLVTLDGSGSSDSDGTIVSYSWERTNNGGPDPTLSDSTAEQPTFTAPDPPGSSQDYEYTLTVEDNDGNTDTDIVVITVNESGGGGGGGNSTPTIDTISNDFSVNEGTTGHSLAATASDPDVGDTLTYAWTFSGNGPITVTMYNADTLNPTFDVSTFNGNNSRDITFTLTVTDDSGEANDTATDTVVVTVNHT